jgi:hypothetical protein
MPHRPACARLLRSRAAAVVLVPVLQLASQVTSSPVAGHTALLRAEVARGAAAVASLTERPFPYAVTYRAIKDRLQKNVQEHADSDAFRVGAHLAVTAWLSGLPEDVSWRARALARHRDIVGWLLPRVALTPDAIADCVVEAQRLSPAAAQRLHDLVALLRHSD